jgi:uncharacterized protein YbaR (Trm112 family)
MHLLLTDRLSCPRCGPEFGLILLAREMRGRRVVWGEFGCPNCREQYPVEDGFGDLRAPPRQPLSESPSSDGEGGREEEDPEAGLRLAALMGVTEGPGTVLIVGPSGFHAPEVHRHLPGVEVVGMDPSLRELPQVEGVSRMVGLPGIPFFAHTFLGVVLSGPTRENLILEGWRVLAPKGGLAVLEPPGGVRGLLEDQGARILLGEEGVLVARKERGAGPELVTLRGS